jgi:hypothetical protein
MKNRVNSRLILSAKAIIALAVLSTAFYWATGLSQKKNNYVDISILVRETEKIAPPDGVVLIGESSNHKASAAIVSKRYKTALNQSQVFDYYKSGLKSAGWSRVDSSGGSISEYCKGVLRAEVEFNSGMGFYTFSVTWRQRVASKCGA